jgi:cell division protein FtsQ
MLLVREDCMTRAGPILGWEPLAELLRRHVRTLSGLLLLLVLGVTVRFGMQWLSDPYRFPLSVVKVTGDFRYLQKQQLQETVAPYAQGGFFTVDVAAVRNAAESLPWVYKASVQRIWPATLHLHVEEQQPIAHWGEAGYLNRFGEPFFPELAGVVTDLPWLAGPRGQELRVLENYQRIVKTLAHIGVRTNRLELDNRRAWHLQLASGVQLELGRADAWKRLQRFVVAYPSVFAGRLAELQRVDLRYSNGFSVYWQQAAAEESVGGNS